IRYSPLPTSEVSPTFREDADNPYRITENANTEKGRNAIVPPRLVFSWECPPAPNPGGEQWHCVKAAMMNPRSPMPGGNEIVDGE
ncbi:MAG: hypothetical protein KKD28_06570, partial [Chloroflexi bacterium]|nr:hypothetical protein [Chloroflexota bacterium]